MFRTVCSHKVVAVGFNTLCYDAECRGIKPSATLTIYVPARMPLKKVHPIPFLASSIFACAKNSTVFSQAGVLPACFKSCTRMSDCYGRETSRKPRLLSRRKGLLTPRNARAAPFASSIQLPPRKTRESPDAAPA